MRTGRVYLVGAGPGDPGLLTLRGRQVLAGADVVVYDALICERLLEHAPAGAERIYVGKRAGEHTLPQERINQLLVDCARAGRTVVRLKGGDPFVFGRGGEEALALAEAGVAFEVVPGVTAAVAAAACAGIPVTHRGLSGGVAMVTAHAAADGQEAELDWPTLAAWKGTLAFYMGVANLGEVCRRLMEHGLRPQTPAAVVHWGTTPRQKVVAGTVASLPGLAEEARIEPPAVILVGQVVGLRDRLGWFERRPLLGRRVVVTRPRAQAGELAGLLEAAGAEVVECPTIRIEPPADPAPLRRAVEQIGSFDWVLFTSVNAVEAVFDALASHGRDARALGRTRVAAVGPATAARLTERGIRPDAQAQPHTTAALADLLRRQGELAGRRVLCPRSDAAPPDLTDALAAAGASLTEVVAYRTVPDPAAASPVAEMLAADAIHWLTFTSASTADGFFAAVDPRAIRRSSARIATIGPATSQAVARRNLPVAAEAENHTVRGLTDAIIQRETAARTDS